MTTYQYEEIRVFLKTKQNKQIRKALKTLKRPYASFSKYKPLVGMYEFGVMGEVEGGGAKASYNWKV